MKYLIVVLIALFCAGCQENGFSDEVLEEFFVLDKSIEANNKIIKEGIRIATREISENAFTKTRYLPILHKVHEIETISLGFHAYIDTLRERLTEESGGIYTKTMAEKLGKPELEGRPIGQNDKKIPHQIFLSGDEAKGELLFKKILQLRETYIHIITKMWDNEKINATAFADSSIKEKVIENLRAEMVLNGIDNYKSETHQNKTWAEFTFENKSVAAIYPVLRKLQNDAKILEAVIVNFLHFQQSTIPICGFNPPFVMASTSTSNVQLGETYEADITLVQLLEDAKFSVSVNNQNIRVAGRFATYRIKPTSIGKKKYTAKIALENPLTHEISTFTQDFYYEVVN